ncbi:MAG: bacillithiol transferase BstA [Bacteroidia bacterium]|nr:bacillithiol transferase BstA [Bacteroidia bacterium]
MNEDLLEKLKYPIGRFQKQGTLTAEQRKTMIRTIAETPDKVRRRVENLTDAQLDTPYRPEGWTIRQVVHHMADSHMNSYIRFKWTLTEDEPLIKTYNQKGWAELPDSLNGPVSYSLALLEALHTRWVVMLNHMSEQDFRTRLTHPEQGKIDLDHLLALYDWHCRHHLAHIESVKF